MLATLHGLCDEGPFNERLEAVTSSCLIRLEKDDLTGELGKDLKYILDWTKFNLRNGKLSRKPNELQRNKLIEKILHLFIETIEK